MRILVVILAMLAAVKIYAQDQMYRTAVTEALVSAYRDQAILACRNDRTKHQQRTADLLWSNPTDIRVSIGRSDLNAGLWNGDLDLWNAAYKKPYLVLEPADPLTPLQCLYDITSGAVSVSHRST